MANQVSYVIAPGQTRVLSFSLGDISSESAPLEIEYKPLGTTSPRVITTHPTFRYVDSHEFQKITYKHPNGIVSYAMLRPPSKASCSRSTTPNAPIFLMLHGAGVEADSPLVRNSLVDLPDLCAWVLCPSGVTTWSGDDWRKYDPTMVRR
jgi:hypothetical protein